MHQALSKAIEVAFWPTQKPPIYIRCEGIYYIYCKQRGFIILYSYYLGRYHVWFLSYIQALHYI